jgi:hypothetical protein
MHWHSFQILILVHICYKWNPNYLANPDFGEKKLFTKYHYYILDDNEHDNHSFNIVLSSIGHIWTLKDFILMNIWFGLTVVLKSSSLGMFGIMLQGALFFPWFLLDFLQIVLDLFL